jgi:transposase
MNEQRDKELLSLVLPSGILEFFIITQVIQSKEQLDFHLEEKNIIPQEYINNKVTSKGFYDEIKVQDFPIRGKEVYLHIKRRRWLNESTGNIVIRDWELVAKGTRMTKEFASFLKVISRYQAGKL